MEFSERLRYAIDNKGISVYKIAKDTGIHKQSIARYLEGKAKPLGDNVRLLANYLEVSVDWLLSGKEDKNVSNSKVIGTYDSNALAQVPFITIAATASFVETCCDEKVITESIGIQGYTQDEIKKYGYVVIEINGCSMEPTIMNKARILCKRVDPSDWNYIPGGIYVVGYGRDMLVTKRIKHNDLLEKGTLTLYSDNKEYGVLTIEKDAIRCIWKGIEIIKQKLL